ncbi:MAG: hypothetical protein QXZ20_03165, partial [Candidatus Aenigmatarchaeota archaeon]
MSYFLKNDGSFVIKNYNSTFPFSNFLAGISGVWGVPLWVFYVNRAQAIASFGIQDKNHSIMEFYPANKSYSLVSNLGFRTFVKIDKKINYEPFRIVSNYPCNEEMIIRSASLTLKSINNSLGLSFEVRYFTLPNTVIGALVRILKIENISSKKINLEVLDGLPQIVPFGLNHVLLKDLSRTMEAWMQASIEDSLATFKLSVDPKDTSQTKYIEGANFNYSFYEKENKEFTPYLIVDPQVIFAEDTSYSLPINFFKNNFKIPLAQTTDGKTPCSFSYLNLSLEPKKEFVLYSIFGTSFNFSLLKNFVKTLNAKLLKEKENENEDLIEDIKNNALCISGIEKFNHYLKSTYLDNVLRGGFPYRFNHKDIYYVFSRKHGDLERDYNKFKLLPSYFSEGEANYRDINQNRRLDLF